MKMKDLFIRLFVIVGIWLEIFLSFSADDLKIKALMISFALMILGEYLEYIIKYKE